MKRWAYRIIGVLSIVVLLCSSAKITGYFLQGYNSRKINTYLQESTLKKYDNSKTIEDFNFTDYTCTEDTVPVCVVFDKLIKTNSDIIGWLYCENTPINYPILQGEDNCYYLEHLPDKSRNLNGSLFADCRNASDFSDLNTIIYGHNIHDGSLFGSLKHYREQVYYDANPIMWLLLPNHCYKIEVTAGCIVCSDSHFYSVPNSGAEAVKQAREAVEKSTFVSGVEPTEKDTWVTLSTCSYEFDNARYIILGKLVCVG